MGLRNGELVGGELRRNVDAAGGCFGRGIRIRDFEVGTVLSNAEGDLVVELDGVDALRVDLAEVVDDAAETAVPVAAEVEAVKPVDTVFFAIGNAVEIVFHAGGEVILHEVGEEVLEQANHGERNPVGHKGGTSRSDIPAVDDRRDDRRIGGRAPDPQLFQGLYQARLGVARRGAGLVALRLDIGHCQLLSDGERRELGFGRLRVVVALLVPALLVRLQEPTESDDRAARGELGHGRALYGAGRDDDGGRHALGISHLRGDGALPDQVVKFPVIAAQCALELTRRAKGVTGGADRLVGLLRILALARVGARFLRDALGAVKRGRLTPGGAHRLLREVERVRTHIGDVAVFVQSLGDAHRLPSGEAQLARGFLLQR